MKHNIIALGLFILTSFSISFAYAQTSIPVPIKENSIYYEEVVKVDSLFKQNDLFLKSKQWIAQNFVTSSNYNPIQHEDKDNGLITIRIYLKEFTNYTFGYDYFVNVSCIGNIRLKDGRFKYSFSDFKYKTRGVHTPTNTPTENEEGSCDSFISGSNSGISKKFNLRNLENIDLLTNDLIKTLKKTLSQPLIEEF